MDGITMRGGMEMLAIKQLDLAYKRLRYSVAFSFPVAVLSVLELWSAATKTSLLLWLAVLCAVLAMRYVDARQFQRLGYGANHELQRWKNRYTVGVALEGACWGATVVLFLVSPHDDAAAMMMFIIAGITAFASVSMATIRRAVTAFLLAALLPMAAWLFSFKEMQHDVMGAFALIYMGLMLLFSHQMRRMIGESLAIAEQNKALSATVREGDLRMLRYIENAPGFFYTAILHPDGSYTVPFASSSIRELCGLEAEAVMADYSVLFALIHPDDTGQRRRKIEESKRELIPYCIEYRITHPLKGERWLEAHAQPQRQPDGGTRWDGYMHDITEHKRTADALAVREREFRVLAENLPDPVFRYDRDCRRVYVNPAAERVTATPAAQLLGDLTVNCAAVESASAARATASIREVFATGERRSIFVEYIVDGQTSEYQGVLVPEFGADGQVATVLAIAHEVTDLRAAERRAASFFANMPGFAYTFSLSPDGRMSFPFASRGIEEIFGLHPDEVKDDAAQLLELVSFDDRERVKAEIFGAVQAPQPFQVAARVQQPGQPERWIECRSMPERQADGTVLWHGVMLDITERKRMEEALQCTTESQKLLLDSLRDVGMWQLVVENGKIIYHNDSHVGGLLGYAAGDFDVSPDYIEVIHPDDRARIAEMYRRRLAGEAMPSSYEIGLLAKDGSRREHQLYVSLIPDSDPPRTMTLAVDITERKRMEEALAVREREFRSLAENLPDNIVRWDSQGCYAYVNPTAERTIGASSEEVCGKRPSEAFADGRFSELENAIDRILASGQAMPCVQQAVPMENGEIRYHEVSLAPERDAAGRIVGVLGVGRDMTEIHRMQETIAAREQEFRSLAENSMDSIIRYDREGRIRYLNPVLQVTLGLSGAEAVIGRRPHEAWPDGRFGEIERAAAQVVASGRPVSLEIHVVDGAGASHHHHVLVAPERDASGHVVGSIAFGRDITAAKEAEALLAERYRQIEELNRHLQETSCTLEEQAVELEMSQEQLKAALEYTDGIIKAIPDLLFEMDRDGRYLSVWTQIPELLAAQKEQLLGRTVHEVLSPEAAVIMMEGLREAGELGMSFGKIICIALPQGERWFELSISRKPGDAMFDKRFLVLSRDVTERKQMELALQEGEARYRQNYHLLQSVFESASEVSVFALDRDYRYLSFNAKHRSNTQRLRGVDIAVGMSMLDAIRREEFREFCRAGFDRVLAGDSIAVESREEIVHSDGSVTYEYYENHGSPIRNDAGEIVGLTVFTHNITARKQYEEQLALLNHALDQSDPAFLLEDGRVVYANKSTCRVLGYSEQEIIGMAVQEIDPHVSPELLAKIQQAMEGRGFCVFESRHKTKDGRTFPVEVNLTALNFGGKVRRLSVARDITERKAIEKTLHDREMMLQEAQRIAHVGSWDVDVVNDKLVWSDEIFRIWEIDKTKFKADFAAFMETVHPEDRELVGRVYNESLINHSLYEVEHRLLFPDGRVKYILERGEPQYDAQGKPVRFIGTSLDITERKRMEEALALREQEFRTLVENTPDTIARYDRECRRTFANASFCALVEGGAAALLGKTPSECPGGAEAEIYEARIGEVFATGQDVELELNWQDADGSEVCSHIHLTAERDASGAVVSVLAVGHDITELNLSRQKIHQMAYFDALTALPNRVLFKDRLHQMLVEAAHHGYHAGVMMLDLDRFKGVNDTLGHAAGDKLLHEAGRRLTSCLRDYDTVARLGGDEFALLLPEVRSGDDVGTIARKILDVFKEPFMLEGREVFISTSVGIAVYPEDSTDADELVRQADVAMYAAKNSGRNAFRCYSRDLTESANEKLTLEGDLRRGFGRNELELFYQPKIRLADGMLLGSEALLRWRHPTCGMVPPDKFIPIAEDSGLIVEIGAWVLRDACRTACAWNGPGKPLHKVAINLSARQFQAGNLLQIVRDALSETNCRTEWIELEITESLLLDEDGSVLELLEALRKMGITIAIDDFGTGYSSLGYLARFPIDTLKIDRSFTCKVTSSEHHAELVKAMIAIANSLNQQVVAEGVETEEEAAFLREHGCHIAQGYLYGKPVPKAQFGLIPFSLRKRERRLKPDAAGTSRVQHG